jgi:ATP-binding protein involved in chromosome partitioning
MDPRPAAVDERLAGVGRIVAVGGSKGGIGKSVLATGLALAGADRGRRVGLLDLDFTSPTDHVILGAHPHFPAEEFGIDPHPVEGVAMMSVAFFSGEAAAPLRGGEATNLLLELLAITRWGELDTLLIDLPPGLGDTTLDLIRLLPRAEFLLIGTASRVVIESVRRALRLLSELRIPLLGVVENLRRDGSRSVENLADEFGVPFLGSVLFDPGLEDALGSPEGLRATALFAAVGRLAEQVVV